MQAKPIEVFAVDGLMNRATGSIPYTSLTWHRRYYEPGEFSMVIPASLFDPSWRFIETDERPETGIIQKVEFTDTPTSGSDDTVTVSGFFLEAILNRHTFLDETPEQVTERYYVSPPSPPSASLTKPKIYTANTDGKYWYSTPGGTSYGVADGTPSTSPDRVTGGEITDNGDGTATVQVAGTTIQLTEVSYGSQINSYYYEEENGVQVDGKIFRSQLMADGEHLSAHDVAFDDGNGNVWYHDTETGSLKRATGVTTKASENYTVKRRKWRSTTDNGWVTVTKTVKGPWQTTDALDPITPADNVARCVQWAQMYFQNEILFEEPEITGETKAVNPSFMLLGDLLYQELQTVGASFRLEYDFPTNQFVFSVWQGLDRTQDQPDVPSEPVDPTWYTTGKVQSAQIETNQGSPAGKTIIYGASQLGQGRLPDGYTELDYIESTGTQYIDTGIKASSNVRLKAEFDCVNTHNTIVFGSRNASNNATLFVLLHAADTDQWRDDFGTEKTKVPIDSVPVSGHIAIDKNKNVTNINGYQVSHASTSFTSTFNIYLFGCNTGGTANMFSSVRMQSCQIYENNVMKRDFVPCKRDSDGSCGLFDVLNSVFYGNSGSGSFAAGPEVVLPTVPMSNVALLLNDLKWNIDLGGNTLGEGKTLTIQRDGTADIDGTSIPTQQMPLMPDTNVSIITDSSLPHYFDVEYQGYQPPVGGKNPWAVFSDTWGSLYGFTASRDESNYRNTCYVLYDYDCPTSWESNGAPALSPVYEWNDSGTSRTLVGYRIPYATKRGFLTAKIDDGLDARETYLDLRDSPPAGDDEWSRQMYDADSVPTLPSLKDTYDAYEAGLESQGMAKLTNDYPVITSLDTGDLDLSRYLADYDLGDLVDMSVSTVGLEQAARIIGVVEVYEAGKSTVTLEIGEKQLTILQKARLN